MILLDRRECGLIIRIPFIVLTCTKQTVTLDGGEFRSLAGEFNGLRQIPEEMWDMMEKMIRDSNKKQKSKI